jgi:tetratricopeptide (TPR) repeat protein
MRANIVFRFLFVAIMPWLSAGSLIAAQNGGDLLEPDKTIERDLAGGETHSYRITLASGQFLEASIAQRQMDVTATLFGPDGRQVGQFDSLWYGAEPVCYIAEATGGYRLEIRTVNQTATRGPYQLKLEKLRAPAPQDQTRVAAIRASTEGKQLLEQGKAQTLIPAKKKLEEALPLWREVGDRFQEAQTLDSIGFLFWLLGGPAKGIEYYNQALAIRREIEDRHGEGETLNNMAAAYSALGKKEQALEYYNRALPLRPPGADRAATLGNMGLAYLTLGYTQKAMEHYDQALPLWRSAGNRVGEANALLMLGAIHGSLGENQQALDYLNRGSQIAREANDRRGEAHAMIYLGKLYIELGEYEKALDFFGQALSLFRVIGDKSGEAMSLVNQGVINGLLGAREKALDLYSQANSSLKP